MPKQPEVRSTSHDRHDALLVAALAAGDLAGTDRDHATDLIETCQDCATLHDDLVAIARATASVPPPIVARPRDFRLTREQAARLRPSGWRRFAGVVAGPRLAFTKPLGIGLATIGLAGLLLVNVNLGAGLGSSAAAPASGGAPAAPFLPGASRQPVGANTDGTVRGQSSNAVAAPAASSVPAPAASPVASSDGAVRLHPVPSASGGSPQTTGFGTESDTAGGPKSTAAGSPGPANVTEGAGDGLAGREAAQAPPPDLRTLVFVAAVLVGLALLVLRRVARGVAAS